VVVVTDKGEKEIEKQEGKQQDTKTRDGGM
jgi:hypothetical protein